MSCRGTPKSVGFVHETNVACSVDHATPLCDFDLSDASTSTSSPYLQANHRFHSGASGYQLEAVRLDMGASNIFVQLRSLGHDVRLLGLRGRERTMHSVLFQVACLRLNSSIGARFLSHTLNSLTHHHDHPPPPTHTPNQPTPPPLCLAAWSLFWVCLGTLLVLLLRLPIVRCVVGIAAPLQLQGSPWNLGEGSVANTVFLDRLVVEGERGVLGSRGSSFPWGGDDPPRVCGRRLTRKTPPGLTWEREGGLPASEATEMVFPSGPDLQEVARRTTISLELEWARRGSPPGLPRIGSRRHQAWGSRSVSLTEEGVHWYTLFNQVPSAVRPAQTRARVKER